MISDKQSSWHQVHHDPRNRAARRRARPWLKVRRRPEGITAVQREALVPGGMRPKPGPSGSSSSIISDKKNPRLRVRGNCDNFTVVQQSG